MPPRWTTIITRLEHVKCPHSPNGCWQVLHAYICWTNLPIHNLYHYVCDTDLRIDVQQAGTKPVWLGQLQFAQLNAWRQDIILSVRRCMRNAMQCWLASGRSFLTSRWPKWPKPTNCTKRCKPMLEGLLLFLQGCRLNIRYGSDRTPHMSDIVLLIYANIIKTSFCKKVLWPPKSSVRFGFEGTAYKFGSAAASL